jgi:hypothetical protein
MDIQPERIDEDRIRELAYQLWMGDGCQEGRQDEYWYAARRQLEAQAETPAEPADPHPSDEDRQNVYNPSPGGDRAVEGRMGDLEANPRNRASPA